MMQFMKRRMEDWRGLSMNVKASCHGAEARHGRTKRPEGSKIQNTLNNVAVISTRKIRRGFGAGKYPVH